MDPRDCSMLLNLQMHSHSQDVLKVLQHNNNVPRLVGYVMQGVFHNQNSQML